MLAVGVLRAIHATVIENLTFGRTRIVTDATTNLASARFFIDPASGSETDYRFGGGTSTRSAFVDDDFFAMRDSTSETTKIEGSTIRARSYLVSHSLAEDTSFLPSGVTFCDCNYLNWGYWGGDFKFLDTSGANVNRRDRIHLATWVVGEASLLSTIQGLTGTATYSGHANGSVWNNGDIYQAVGNFSSTVNFGTPSASTVSLTNFDGGSYSGTGLTIAGVQVSDDSSVALRNSFTGSFSGTSGTASGRTGSLKGTFYAGGGNPAAEMGGRFSISGTNYKAGGTFAAAP